LVGREQIYQMGSARSWQPNHDDRRLQLNIESIWMAPNEVLQSQPRRKQTNESAANQKAPEP
jgi:hypothetical protein